MYYLFSGTEAPRGKVMRALWNKLSKISNTEVQDNLEFRMILKVRRRSTTHMYYYLAPKHHKTKSGAGAQHTCIIYYLSGAEAQHTCIIYYLAPKHSERKSGGSGAEAPQDKNRHQSTAHMHMYMHLFLFLFGLHTSVTSYLQ
jgi:hypothetical protein